MRLSKLKYATVLSIAIAVISLWAAWQLLAGEDRIDGGRVQAISSSGAGGLDAGEPRSRPVPPVAASPQASIPETPNSMQADKVFAKFAERSSSLGALLQSALVSKSPVELEAAQAYLRECNLGVYQDLAPDLRQPNKSGFDARDPGQGMRQKLEKMAAFCGHMATMWDENILRSLEAAWQTTNQQPFGQPRIDARARILEAVATGSGELVRLRLNELGQAQAVAWMQEFGYALPLKGESRAVAAFTTYFMRYAMTAVICEQLGCDRVLVELEICRDSARCDDAPLQLKLQQEFVDGMGVLGAPAERWQADKSMANIILANLRARAAAIGRAG